MNAFPAVNSYTVSLCPGCKLNALLKHFMGAGTPSNGSMDGCIVPSTPVLLLIPQSRQITSRTALTGFHLIVIYYAYLSPLSLGTELSPKDLSIGVAVLTPC